MLISKLMNDAKIEYNGGAHEIDGLVYDSRMATARCVFVCLTGAQSDGHAFAQSAYNLGCRAFVVERILPLPTDAEQIKVENTRIALAKLSAAFFDFPADKLNIIGITGTKGKTTTSLMLYDMFNSSGVPTGYIGSNGVMYHERRFDTKNTTPESFELHAYFSQMLECGIRTVVLEVSSQALYLNRVYGIHFDTVAFTNLAPDHLSEHEHPTFEHYRECKHMLFRDFGASYIAYNADDEYSKYMLEDCSGTPVGYGLYGGEIYARDIKEFMREGDLGVGFTLCLDGGEYAASLKMPGEFNVYNALCAVCVARHNGISMENILFSLESTTVCGRFEIVRTPLPAIFIIDYSHNGFALSHALETLRGYEPRRLICVIGSVGGRTECRRAELGAAVSAGADVAILTSDNPDFESPEKIIADIKSAFVKNIETHEIPDRAEAVKFAVENSRAGDIVLFAGKGHESYQLINGTHIPFCERKLIEKYSAELAIM